MARNTFGHIYVIRLADSRYMFTTPQRKGCSYKVGKTTDITSRTRTIGLLLPHASELMIAIPAIDIHWGERYIHEKLAHLRINGEWFALTRPYMHWLMLLGSPYVSDICEDYREELEQSFRFYNDFSGYDPE